MQQFSSRADDHVQVKGLAYRGERYMRESGLIEQMEVDPEPCPPNYDLVPHIDFLDQMGTYIAVAYHPETEANEVIFDGEPIAHADSTAPSNGTYPPTSTDKLTWGYGGRGPRDTARTILEHAFFIADDPPDVDLVKAQIHFRGFDAYTILPQGESGEIITHDEVMEFLRQQAAESEE